MGKHLAPNYHQQIEASLERLIRALRKGAYFNDLNSRMILNSIEIKYRGSGLVELVMDEGLSPHNRQILLDGLRATFDTESITIASRAVNIYFADYDFDTSAGSERPLPPKRGERLLLLILPKDEREHVQGDLEEEYAEIAVKQGKRFANIWYYRQVLGSAWPMLRRALRWGLLASLGEWIRRII